MVNNNMSTPFYASFNRNVSISPDLVKPLPPEDVENYKRRFSRRDLTLENPVQQNELLSSISERRVLRNIPVVSNEEAIPVNTLTLKPDFFTNPHFFVHFNDVFYGFSTSIGKESSGKSKINYRRITACPYMDKNNNPQFKLMLLFSIMDDIPYAYLDAYFYPDGTNVQDVMIKDAQDYRQNPPMETEKEFTKNIMLIFLALCIYRKCAFLKLVDGSRNPQSEFPLCTKRNLKRDKYNSFYGKMWSFFDLYPSQVSANFLKKRHSLQEIVPLTALYLKDNEDHARKKTRIKNTLPDNIVKNGHTITYDPRQVVLKGTNEEIVSYWMQRSISDNYFPDIKSLETDPCFTSTLYRFFDIEHDEWIVYNSESNIRGNDTLGAYEIQSIPFKITLESDTTLKLEMK